jgi:hypothetical protein
VWNEKRVCLVTASHFEVAGRQQPNVAVAFTSTLRSGSLPAKQCPHGIYIFNADLLSEVR